MQDLEDRLRELGDRVSREAPPELRPSARALRTIRVGRAVRSGAVLAAVTALVIGGFAGARSLTSDEALPPAERDSNVSPFVDTWTSTDVDGKTRTMVIRASGEDAYEITVHNPVAPVCSGAPSTLSGTARDLGSKLWISSPEITCDDGSEPKLEDGDSPPEEVYLELGGLSFEHDPESDILTNYSPLEGRTGLTLIWGRAEGENRIGDVSGWITYGDEHGIWARDLTSPDDPSDRVRLSSTPASPIEWSRHGAKLLVGRDRGYGDLFVVNSDGTETRLTDTNGSIRGSSFSPDGAAVVYAEWRVDSSSAISVVDAEGGSPQVLLTSGSRRYPDKPGRFETLLQEPKWSPDGSQIAYFDGMGDGRNSLRVMDSDGTDSRVVAGWKLGAGHVYGLQWSPDGSQLAYSIENSLYVVGVDGSGFRLVTDNGLHPYWSPDGSYIAYTRPDPQAFERGLEIVSLDDLQVQNFGDGESGPWTSELRW